MIFWLGDLVRATWLKSYLHFLASEVLILLLFLTVTSIAIDSDTAMNAIRITNKDGNSETVNCKDDNVDVGKGDAVTSDRLHRSFDSC